MMRGRGRIGWAGAALLAGLLAPSEAGAVIPYEGLITPGQLRGISYAPGDPWHYGYWEYLPSNFDEFGAESLPLLVFFPGIGEYDDVSVCPGGTDTCPAGACGGDGLCRNLTWGPQRLMRLGQWDETVRPFLFVSPQHNVPPFSTQQWDLARLDDFMQFIIDEYPVDPRRVYLIGMSQGGRAVLQYTQAYPRRFTAVAPAPGGQVDIDASCYFQDTALWVFHGEDDNNGLLGAGVFNPCNMVGVAYQYDNPDQYPGYPQCVSIVGEPRPPGRLTMFYNVGHNAWRQAVDPIAFGFPANEWTSDQGCGIPADFRELEPALDADGVYTWFLSLDRPDVTAPDDFTHDAAEVSLTADILDFDPISTIAWTQTAGPAAVLANEDTETVDVSGLMPSESYTFEVYVVDADSQWDRDEVVITTEPVFGGGGSSGGGESTGGGGSEGGSTSGAVSGTTGGGESTGFPGTTSGGADGTTGDPDPGTTSGDPGADTGTDDGRDPSAGTSSTPPDSGDSGGNSGVDPGTSMTGGSDDGPEATDGGGGDGCGCRADGPGGGTWWAWGIVALGIARRRRR